MADLSQDYVDSRSVYRVTCQDCYEILVEVEGSPFDSSDGACDIIAALDKQGQDLERQYHGLKSLFLLTAASLLFVDVPAIRMYSLFQNFSGRAHTLASNNNQFAPNQKAALKTAFAYAVVMLDRLVGFKK